MSEPSVVEIDVANALARLYVSYRQKFTMIKAGGVFFVPKKQGIAIPLSDWHLLSHVRREYAVGIYAGARASKFLCFDVDSSDVLIVRGIVKELAGIGVPTEMQHISTSGGKGYHIDVFFDKMVYTSVLKRVFTYLTTRIDMRHVEFRPTHTQSIKLPLSLHGKTGNMCWYLNQETLKPIEDLAYALRIIPFSGESICEIAQSLCIPADPAGEARPNINGVPMCLDTSLPRDRIVRLGTRHALMVH